MQSADPAVLLTAENGMPAVDWLSVSPTEVVLPSGPDLSTVTLTISGEHLRHNLFECLQQQAGVILSAMSGHYGNTC